MQVACLPQLLERQQYTAAVALVHTALRLAGLEVPAAVGGGAATSSMAGASANEAAPPPAGGPTPVLALQHMQCFPEQQQQQQQQHMQCFPEQQQQQQQQQQPAPGLQAPGSAPQVQQSQPQELEVFDLLMDATDVAAAAASGLTADLAVAFLSVLSALPADERAQKVRVCGAWPLAMAAHA